MLKNTFKIPLSALVLSEDEIIQEANQIITTSFTVKAYKAVALIF